MTTLKKTKLGKGGERVGVVPLFRGNTVYITACSKSDVAPLIYVNRSPGHWTRSSALR